MFNLDNPGTGLIIWLQLTNLIKIKRIAAS